MSRDASIEFDWADGHYKFRLAVGELRELDEKTDRGPLELLRMMDDGTWRAPHVRETIRIGLIGGGATPTKAMTLVKRYVDDRPLMESVIAARAILFAAVAGPRDGERPGKRRAAKAAADQPQSEQEASSHSPPSTQPHPS